MENESVASEAVLRGLIEYIPDFYKEKDNFKEGLNLLEKNNIESSVKCFIKLADEPMLYFSDEFWIKIKIITLELGVKELSKFCQEKIERNKKDIDYSIPYGWAIVKINDASYQSYISKKLQLEDDLKRRKKDKVFRFIKKDGVHIVPYGADGFLYFVHAGKIAEFYYDREGSATSIHFDNETKWIFPEDLEFSSFDKINAYKAMILWAKENKTPLKIR
jgi:hypothetical protein